MKTGAETNVGVKALLKNEKGYTLVEMIIVIAIMGSLIGGMAAYMGYINSGKTQKSMETLKRKLDMVQVDNMSKKGKTYLYLYKKAEGTFCKIVNTEECTDTNGNVKYSDGFTSRGELNSFLDSSPETSDIAGKNVEVKATGVKADGTAAEGKTLDINNMLKVGFDKVTGAFECSSIIENLGSDSYADFYDTIEFIGRESYKMKLVKTTGKHIEE